MEEKIISKLKNDKLTIDEYKIKQNNDEEDLEIIKKFNKDLEKIKDFDDKLIAEVNEKLKNLKNIFFQIILDILVN